MKHQYSQLLIEVQKKSNIPINCISDIKFLKEDIESITGIKIGFNTLRRLFGFLEKTNPSITTLNSLSKYIGFNSFSHYKNKQKKFNEWYFQQYLQRLLLSKKVTDDDVNVINTNISNGENINYLAYFLSFQIQSNNLALLDFIFKNVSFKNVSGTNIQKFSTILSTSLLNISEKKSLSLFKALIHHNSFRNYIPLAYLDYTHLNSRYLKFLDVIEELGDNDADLLFVSLMKFYNHFYREDDRINMNIKKPKEFDSMYIVLKGRFYGFYILSKKLNSSKKKQIIETKKLNRSNHFLQEVVPALIIKEEYTYLEELIYMFYEDLFESDRWDANTASGIYLIALANVNWKNNNIKSAISSLELVELDKIELGYENYVTLFYYLTKLKISFSEKNKLENIKVYLSIKEIVEITGFKKFITESKKYLLK